MLLAMRRVSFMLEFSRFPVEAAMGSFKRPHAEMTAHGDGQSW